MTEGRGAAKVWYSVSPNIGGPLALTSSHLLGTPSRAKAAASPGGRGGGEVPHSRRQGKGWYLAKRLLRSSEKICLARG